MVVNFSIRYGSGEVVSIQYGSGVVNNFSIWYGSGEVVSIQYGSGC